MATAGTRASFTLVHSKKAPGEYSNRATAADGESLQSKGARLTARLTRSARLDRTRLKRGQARIVDSRTGRMGRIWCESWRLASN